MQPRAKPHAASGAAASPFEFSGGALCLDFANTVNRRPMPDRRELLTSPAALVAWSREAGLLAEGAAREALRQTARRPEKSQALLRRGLALREAIYSVCSAVAAKAAPRRAEVAALSESLGGLLAQSVLRAQGRGFAWAHRAGSEPLTRALWAVARSAADLLTSDALPQLRECGGETCGWLFLDRSKNGSRRWCDMKVCGNRAKVRRFRRRALRGAG